MRLERRKGKYEVVCFWISHSFTRKYNWFHNHGKTCNGQDRTLLSASFLTSPLISWTHFSYWGLHSSASSGLSSLAPRMLGRPEPQCVKSSFNEQWSCSRTCLFGSGGSPYPQRRLRQQWWEKIWRLKSDDKRDFPTGSLAKTPCSHYWGPRFHPKSGK